jgi:hypothetical protein
VISDLASTLSLNFFQVGWVYVYDYVAGFYLEPGRLEVFYDLRNRKIPVMFSVKLGLNFSATFRSEAKEKIKVVGQKLSDRGFLLISV